MQRFLSLLSLQRNESMILRKSLGRMIVEIGTGAREAFGEDFRCILAAYNFKVDMEDVIVPRE
eukprot:scaffold732_cov48-Attheya_sp.AAC.11